MFYFAKDYITIYDDRHFCLQCFDTVGWASGKVSHTHTHPFNSSLSGTTRVSQYQKGKTNLDFTGARDNEWQTDNHASTPPLSFFQAGCPSCHPTNSVKALKAEKASGL